MNARIYSMLLSLYPAELREDFGAEMTQVFLDDLEDSVLTRGFLGVVCVWRRTLKELLAIALSAFATKREIAVPLIMYALQEIYIGGILLMTGDRTMPKSIGQRIFLLFVSGLFPAVIAFVALRVGNRSVPEPLNLSSK
jgi:hypothetical protein